MDGVRSRIRSSIDLEKMGYQVGELLLPWSDNTVPLGYHTIPIINIKNGRGKKILVVGGNHGDEFEGPAAIMRVSQEISISKVNNKRYNLLISLKWTIIFFSNLDISLTSLAFEK